MALACSAPAAGRLLPKTYGSHSQNIQVTDGILKYRKELKVGMDLAMKIYPNHKANMYDVCLYIPGCLVILDSFGSSRKVFHFPFLLHGFFVGCRKKPVLGGPPCFLEKTHGQYWTIVSQNWTIESLHVFFHRFFLHVLGFISWRGQVPVVFCCFPARCQAEHMTKDGSTLVTLFGTGWKERRKITQPIRSLCCLFSVSQYFFEKRKHTWYPILLMTHDPGVPSVVSGFCTVDTCLIVYIQLCYSKFIYIYSRQSSP